MSGGGRYTPILPLFLIGCGLLWIGGVPPSEDRARADLGPPLCHEDSESFVAQARAATAPQVTEESQARASDPRRAALACQPPRDYATKSEAGCQGFGEGERERPGGLGTGFSAAMMTALQAITARSTQDLWSSPAAVAIDMSVEQQISKAATASHKLSKRIAGDVKAKDELSKALSEWTSAIGFPKAWAHLAGGPVERDPSDCCITPSFQRGAEPDGVAWDRGSFAPGVSQLAAPSTGFGHGPLSLAPAVPGGGSAFGAISTGAGQDTGAFGLQGFGGREPGGTPMLGGATPDAGDLVRHRRWKRGGAAVPHRPSKSPRREETADAPDGSAPTLSAGPWCMEATGRTPDTIRRPAITTFSDDAELIPDGGGERVGEGQVSWRAAWLQAAAYVVANGGDLIGELDTSPEQDAVWPLQTDDTAIEDVQAEAATFWKTLGAFVQQAQDEQFPGMVTSCQELLQRLRLCPGSLPGIQQGVLVAIHVTLGNILDFQQYGPATAQEWLYPSLLLEHGCECRGMIPRQMSDGMRPLLSIPCPYLVTPSLAEDFGWFLPSASLLLLPAIDAFQVWPVPPDGFVPTAGDSLQSAATVDDRFAVSLPLPHVAESSYLAADGNNAVVLYDNGPSLTLHFARVLPPLDNLPPLQYVALRCVHFVAPPRDRTHLTVMLDTGGRYICVDVQPGRGVRHGDVLRAYEDDESFVASGVLLGVQRSVYIEFHFAGRPLTFSAFRELGTARHPVYGRLWAAVFARNPEVLHHSANVTTGAEAGFQVQSYQLGWRLLLGEQTLFPQNAIMMLSSTGPSIQWQLSILTTRLEEAGVFNEVDHWEEQQPRSGTTPISTLPSSRSLGVMEEDAPEPSEPVPPSSPSYSGVLPPTPDTTIDGEGMAMTVRASDDTGASTAVPIQGDLHQWIPLIAPLSRCELLTTCIGTGFIFEEMLRDYSARRGWQPLVSVQPQPDAAAIHLIPAAADSSQVSVLIRSGEALYPRCLPRSIIRGRGLQVSVRGQRGRIRTPYSTGRDPERPIHLRDGDCLHADMGPFGPPPPQPVNSKAAPLCMPLVLSFLLGLRFPLLGAVMLPLIGGPCQHSVEPRRVEYSLGHFPWRLPRHSQSMDHISGTRACRTLYLCPWCGPQGVFHGAGALTLDELAQRYLSDDPAIPRLFPVWPSDRMDRLTFVPAISESAGLVCVVARIQGAQKSLIVPALVQYDQICRAVQYNTPWEVSQVRFPPAVHAARLVRPRAPLLLRTGDVLDVLACREDAREVWPHSPVAFKDGTLWTRRIHLSFPLQILLWLPTAPQPIRYTVPAGSVWDPAVLSFNGDFRRSFAGSWVPVVWSPSQWIHLIQASDASHTANILVESGGELLAQSTGRIVSPAVFGADRGLEAPRLGPLGVARERVTDRWTLRDGDVIFDHSGTETDLIAWDASGCRTHVYLLFVASLLGLSTGSRLAPATVLLIPFLQACSAARERSRSNERQSDSDEDCTVALVGRWRPEMPHPLADVVSDQRWDYHVLCPFRGWSSCVRSDASTPHSALQSMVESCSGVWVRGHVVLGPSRITSPGVVLPIAGSGLASVVVQAGDTIRAVLVPRVCRLHTLLECCRRFLGATGDRLSLPPALQHPQMPPDAQLRLRDGDTVLLEVNYFNRAFRARPDESVHELYHLNHLNLWHARFRVRRGGWIYVWQDTDNPLEQCQRYWVEKGSVWTPAGCHFAQVRGEPLTPKIVPVPCLQPYECHFVRRTEQCEAQVILHDPTGTPETECRLISVGGPGHHVPGGWQLRPDLRLKAPDSLLRDGDVLVPVNRASARSRLADLLTALGLARSQTHFVAIVILGVAANVDAMLVPPVESQAADTGNVGMFPWRLQAHERACHEAVAPEGTARLFSPFMADTEPLPINPDSTVDEVAIALSSRGPAWHTQIMPLWPALWSPHLCFVPAPDDPRLVCIMVVSPDWQLPLIIPRRTDTNWLRSLLQQLGPGAVSTVRRPPQAAAACSGPNDAVDWRDGDVVLALGPGGLSSYDPPRFITGLAVRTAARWSLDFQCECALPVVMWAPGSRPLRTTMPPGSRWIASQATFTGEFQQRYPGCWVPVPWAYSHDVHLCLRSEDEIHCHIIVEELVGDKLQGTCWSVNARVTPRAFALSWGLRVGATCLLGVPDRATDWPPLRDGDILHFPHHARSAAGRVGKLLGLWALGLCTLLDHRLCAFLLVSAHLPASVSVRPADAQGLRVRHWLWSPHRGRLGPVLCGDPAVSERALYQLEPLWAHGFTRVRPQLDDHDVHWVPRAMANDLANILALGSPGPVVITLPGRISKRLLLRVLRGYFPTSQTVKGNHPALGPAAAADANVFLNDGDLLAVSGHAWGPSLPFHIPVRFDDPVDAQCRGLWSQDLTFEGLGVVFLHRRSDILPTVVPLNGPQRWHAHACSIHPALLSWPDAWWPCPSRTHCCDGLHLCLLADLLDSTEEAFRTSRTLPRRPGQPSGDSATPAVSSDDGEPPDSAHVPLPFNSKSWGRRPAASGALLRFGCFSCLMLPRLGVHGRRGGCLASWSLVILGVYLSAYGAPSWQREHDHWVADLTDVCRLQADMHSTWLSRRQHSELPQELPWAYHGSWNAYPLWAGGVPDELLIATDGSGAGTGSWAFIVWGLFGHRWYRVDWEAARLTSVGWLSELPPTHVTDTRSYHGELAALQAAAMWCLAQLDQWEIYMRSSPRLTTLAVDNSSALTVAAGHAAAAQPWAASTPTWVLDYGDVRPPHALPWHSTFQALAPWLWLIPQAKMHGGRPCFSLAIGDVGWSPPQTSVDTAPLSNADTPTPVPLCITTANIQSIKDAPSNLFNPSGHAARRQFLMSQACQLGINILCLQEARSKAGRWAVGGWLTWRSGAWKGQYGCEIWVKPGIVSPPLQLGDWRILHSCPRLLVITCVSEQFPVTICSAHAPHSDRPDAEARAFWDLLATVLQATPRRRAIVLGLDANGDFCSADDEGVLIGTLISQHEPSRNDEFLLELCLRFGLFAPSTFSDTQVGEGWSWQHTSGRRKRLDHLLFQAGPWEVERSSQALAFDIVNVQQDHVALWAHTILRATAPAVPRPRQRKCLPAEVRGAGSDIWSRIQRQTPVGCPAQVQQLLDVYSVWRQALPSRSPLVLKQRYIQAKTLQLLGRLRDWRAQCRLVKQNGRALLLSLCFGGWRQRCYGDRLPHLRWHQQRLLEAAMLSQEFRLSRIAHNSAKKDKVQHFIHLTASAVELWHQEGRALESISKLRWASRRAAERRAVHAAGGYNIEQELEEQFRAQEGGRAVTHEQIRAAQRSWAHSPTVPCPQAVPTLLQMEAACRRQQAGKAPGPVLNELWKHFPVSAGLWFWRVCTGIALTGREPPQFKLALICALYKKGPAALPQNYRSIALLNGMAKVYHGYLRKGIGHSILRRYQGLQLGGRPGMPVHFAVTAFRCAWSLCVEAQRSVAVLFVDIKAAYYEASRDLIFDGGPLSLEPSEQRLYHLSALVDQLARAGALQLLGVPEEEIALLKDCVACAHWHLVGSDRLFLATRGSRPGDGLADILFGSLFAIALRHIEAVCAKDGLTCQAACFASGSPPTPLQIGWADDLAVITDYASPRELPRVAEIVIDTLHALHFSVNLGEGKTEALLDIRGNEAKAVRGEMLGSTRPLTLPNGAELRLTPEYRYLGVVQHPKDNGRRDSELCAQGGRTAWAHGRNLISSDALPWALRQAWVAGRILPAAYATLATSVAVSERATAPLHGLFERIARVVCGSWRFGHRLHRSVLLCLLGLTAPEHAVVVARTRLVVQLVGRAPTEVWDLFDAAWNRAVPWCALLADACKSVARGVAGAQRQHVPSALAFVRANHRGMLKACRFLSKWGTLQWAFWDLWQALSGPRNTPQTGLGRKLS
ncbi:unnamed protein product [Symbiodinium sp. CCMP2592]|nr:unnamed protein product [Symbiodinium sp. CCMP2592]